MTADIKALALRLAHKHGDCVGGLCFDLQRLEALVRAALAAGLRMGEEVCEEEIMRHGGPFQAQRCAAALRAKADELERQ